MNHRLKKARFYSKYETNTQEEMQFNVTSQTNINRT